MDHRIENQPVRNYLYHSGVLGALVCAAGILCWSINWYVSEVLGIIEFTFTPWTHWFEVAHKYTHWFGVAYKCVAVALGCWHAVNLSAWIRRRWRMGALLGFALVAVTVFAAIWFLPYRNAFAQEFGDGRMRWYHTEIRWDGNGFDRTGGMYHDSSWETDWGRGIPQAIEFGILCTFYGVLLIGCCWFRGRARVPGVTSVYGMALVLLVILPPATGLLVIDYDNWFRAIAVDSISLDLRRLPDVHRHSVFLHAFFLIYFLVPAFIRLLVRSWKAFTAETTEKRWVFSVPP